MGGFLFASEDAQAAADTWPSRTIGGERAALETSITTIEMSGGRLVYSTEVPCLIWDRDHELPRRNGTKILLHRKEFRVAEENRGAIGRDWTFAVAHLPPTQRRAMMMKFQARTANRNGASYVEALPSLAKHGDVGALPDEALVELIGKLNENVFETGRHWVASLPYGLHRQGSYTPYGIGSVDARLHERWTTTALRAGTAEYAYGAFKGDFESVLSQLWQDAKFAALLNTSEVLSPRIEAGIRLNKRIVLSDNVRAQIPTELCLATRQAMAGWGFEADQHKGEPVVCRIRRLLDRALEALHKRGQGKPFDGSKSACEWWAGDDQAGDVEDRMIEAIDRAACTETRS